MTYPTHQYAPAEQSPRPAPVPGLAIWHFRRLLETMAWFAAIVVVVLPLATWWAIDRYGDEIGVSIWEQFAIHGPAWFLLAAGVKATSTYLPVAVAMGSSRGRHATASALAMAGGALCLSVLSAAGMLVETALYGSYGVEVVSLSPHLYADPGDVPLVLAEYALRYFVFALSGMLTGLAYFRFGGIAGTGLLVFTLAPVALIAALMSPAPSGLAGLFDFAVGAERDLTVPDAAVRLGLAAALAAATFVSVRLLAPLVPLRTKVE